MICAKCGENVNKVAPTLITTTSKGQYETWCLPCLTGLIIRPISSEYVKFLHAQDMPKENGR